MTLQLEHVNITVRDMDEAIRFLRTALGDLVVRGGGQSDQGTWVKKWCHLGTDSVYVAIEEVSVAAKGDRAGAEKTGINHAGFVVEDVEAIQRKMEQAGYSSAMAEPHPYRKRLYVTDREGITWEFVQYLSDDPAERNDYSL